MNKLVLFLFASGLISCLAVAQSARDSIVTIGPYRYHDGKKIRSIWRMTDIMWTDPEARHTLRKAKRKIIVLSAVCFTGATYAIYELATPAKGHIARGYIGIGIEALSLPILFSANHNITKAVDVYNQNVHKGAFRGIKPEYYISYTRNAVRLTIKF